MDENHEVIYLGQVQGKEDRYGLIHHTERADHLSFDLNYDNLVGYLESAFAFRPWEVELANGIPSKIRQGSHPKIEISRMNDVTLDKLLEDAGISNKLEFSIKRY
jgi:hypothetical protein